MSQVGEFEAKVVGILGKRPASSETISFLTGLNSNEVLMKLRRLEKWGLVKPITKKEMIIWKACKGEGSK